MSIRDMNERERRRTQRGKILIAIEVVQERATNRRKEAQAPTEPAEELFNDTVVRNWMPLLFDAMIAPDADPDVKRMALEAGDRAHINQIYSAGASQQQCGTLSSPSTGSDRSYGPETTRRKLLEARSGNLRLAPRR
jgi:hypothetical protein